MFLGRFFHNLDDKGRLTIPSRFREELANGKAYVMQGFDQNLMVLPEEIFHNLSKKVSRLTVTDQETRALRRLFFSATEEVEIDRSGRMLISQVLRQHAGLEVNVVVVGSGDYFELWAPDAWEVQNQELLNPQTTATRFADLMITSD
jgi:MraZ protein